MAKQTYTTGQVLTAAQMTTLQANDYNQTISPKTGNYTLIAGDAGTTITMNNASATAITVNTGVFAAGDTLDIINLGAGVCTVTAGTATVSTSAVLTLKQYDAGTLWFSATGTALFISADAADSPLTTKGDLYTYSTTNDRLPVGNNGETLVADSSASVGIRYQAPVNANPVLNSAFQVWQRGTSGSNNSTGTSGYNADRWQNYLNGTITVSRQATNDTTNLPFIQYCARVQRNSGTTSTGPMYHNQNFETLNSVAYAGKTVTLSFYARAGANYSATSNALSAVLQTGTGTDQNIFGGYTGAATPISATATLTTTWQRFTYTGAVASNVSEMCITFQNTPTGTAGANDYYEITGIQLEVGSVATPFKTYAGTIQGELAACQRYYFRITANGSFNSLGFKGGANSTTNIAGELILPVQMRKIPTVLDYASLAWITTWGAGTTVISAAAIFDGSGAVGTNQNVAVVNFTTTNVSASAQQYIILASNNASAYIGLGAEL